MQTGQQSVVGRIFVAALHLENLTKVSFAFQLTSLLKKKTKKVLFFAKAYKRCYILAEKKTKKEKTIIT